MVVVGADVVVVAMVVVGVDVVVVGAAGLIVSNLPPKTDPNPLPVASPDALAAASLINIAVRQV